MQVLDRLVYALPLQQQGDHTFAIRRGPRQPVQHVAEVPCRFRPQSAWCTGLVQQRANALRHLLDGPLRNPIGLAVVAWRRGVHDQVLAHPRVHLT